MRLNILRGVETSLQRLQTDCIDLCQIHGWDSNTPLAMCRRGAQHSSGESARTAITLPTAAVSPVCTRISQR